MMLWERGPLSCTGRNDVRRIASRLGNDPEYASGPCFEFCQNVLHWVEAMMGMITVWNVLVGIIIAMYAYNGNVVTVNIYQLPYRDDEFNNHSWSTCSILLFPSSTIPRVYGIEITIHDTWHIQPLKNESCALRPNMINNNKSSSGRREEMAVRHSHWYRSSIRNIL